MEQGARFAGHRLIKFSPDARAALVEIGTKLVPHEQEILEGWISRQFKTWQPPGFDRQSLSKLFSGILSGILQHMRSGELEKSIDHLEQSGTTLAKHKFPFDALIITVHFLEETYIPILLREELPDPSRWLTAMDEFLHVALAAMANSYFEAYRKELFERAEVGRIVQESLLGHVPASAADLEIAHVYLSAEQQAQLGGDFLDSFAIHNGETAFVIGDLSGHGVEAAAESVSMRSLLRGFMREEPELASAMTRLNQVVCDDLGSGHFATALAISYLPNGRIRLVNAGHPFPLVCHPNGECTFLEAHDAALAINGESNYQANDYQLEAGGVFVMYTDGLIEARSNGRMFGEAGVIETVAAMRDADPRAIVDQLVDAARRYSGGRLDDDVAILVLKRRAN